MSIQAFYAICSKIGVSSPLYKWTPEMNTFIVENRKDHSRAELLILINRQFGTDFSVDQLSSYIEKFHLGESAVTKSRPMTLSEAE